MGRSATNAACAGLLAAEAVGSLLMWAPIPLGWMWVGARVYEATGSMASDLGVVLLGFGATVILVMRGLTRIDRAWVRLRQQAGYEQRQGALTQVVVMTATLGLLGFALWYYVFSDAYIIPFMPTS